MTKNRRNKNIIKNNEIKKKKKTQKIELDIA